MEFRFEDILKNIIPGMLLLIVITICFFAKSSYENFKEIFYTELKDYSSVLLLLLLVASYLVGYVIDALSSVFEYFIIYKVWGAPSYKLLNGKAKRFELLNANEIIDNIYLKCYSSGRHSNISKKISHELFKHANRMKDANASEMIRERVKEYYYSYIFSRNICFGYFISFILLLVYDHKILSWSAIVCMFFILIVLLWRRRDKSFYYSRQVLQASLC